MNALIILQIGFLASMLRQIGTPPNNNQGKIMKFISTPKTIFILDFFFRLSLGFPLL